MNRYLILLRKSIWGVLLAGALLACGEEPPPAPKPKAVSKKIAVQQARPTPPAAAATASPAPMPPAASPTPVASPEAAPASAATPPAPESTPVAVEPPAGATPAAPAAASATPAPVAPSPEPTAASQAASPEAAAPATPAPVAASPEPTAASQTASPEAAAPSPPAEGATPSLVKESMQLASSYDPEGRFDPFEPLFKEQQGPSASSARDKRAKRVPQTPLEKVALAQLKVTAIIRAASGNRALVEDATGKGYVVTVGTYMGLNSGQVVRIENDRVVVEEEIESLTGELSIENQELKLQKPAGEL